MKSISAVCCSGRSERTCQGVKNAGNGSDPKQRKPRTSNSLFAGLLCRACRPGVAVTISRHNISSQYLVTTSRQSSQPSLSAQLTFQAAVSKQSRQFQLTEPHRSCCQVYPDDGIAARPRLAVGLAGLLSPEPGRDDEWPGAPAGPAPRSRLII